MAVEGLHVFCAASACWFCNVLHDNSLKFIGFLNGNEQIILNSVEIFKKFPDFDFRLFVVLSVPGTSTRTHVH